MDGLKRISTMDALEFLMNNELQDRVYFKMSTNNQPTFERVIDYTWVLDKDRPRSLFSAKFYILFDNIEMERSL